MTIFADIQTLEPGAWVELFEIDARPITNGGAGDILRFHGYTQVGPIIWQGLTYEPWPIATQGFKIDPDQPPVPTLAVGNVNGRITALCLAFQDLVGARLTRHRTLGKYLDAVNFPGGNPTADPEQEVAPELWFIERRSAEDSTQVTFELSSPMDFGGRQLPRRQIIANVCSWLAIGGYRGPYCGYTGPAVAKADDTPTDDPVLDMCSGRLVGCGLRFGPDAELPYGSFPAATLIK
ncbi:phage minor tail protein L [Luteibacter jiangsuensis]|uniref:Phage minor tail protein L n=1 Tax=Luteibacter jiangsuensis TaxID=637577 RepID=A0ABX0Q9Z9_9GAMM|nr:phage minor tail protein L [Luteibacter jiangsuensis]NID06659.1 phage minor tail protein L [Luteibacter jiangsuensis]